MGFCRRNVVVADDLHQSFVFVHSALIMYIFLIFDRIDFVKEGENFQQSVRHTLSVMVPWRGNATLTDSLCPPLFSLCFALSTRPLFYYL